jgi:NADPH:quinone reductase
MKAIRVFKTGGPDELRWVDLPEPEPAAGQVLVKIEAAGLNYIDTYQRSGFYPIPLPYTPGVEAAGTVVALGDGVSGLKAGDRVAYAASAPGAYAEVAAVPASALVKVPERVDARTAAAAMLQGMTAHFLTEGAFALQAGHTCLVHAAAGGVGLLLCQVAKQKGARVIGTVSTEAKASLARAAGADELVLYSSQDFEAEVKRLTGNRGVNVVYDSVGQATFDKSLNCLAPRGTLVLFGQSSGPVAPFNPLVLSQKGSLFLTRPLLFHYIADRESLERRAGAVLGAVAAGALKVRIERDYPLAEAAEAHRALEGRKTSGKVLLVP